jgi:hypothetical protein
MEFKSATMVSGRMALCCTLYRKAPMIVQMAARDGMALVSRCQYDSELYKSALEWCAFIVYEPVKAFGMITEILLIFRNIEAMNNEAKP